MWITSHHQGDEQSRETSSIPFKLSLEVWSHRTGEPQVVIDWSAQTFRQGQASLGEVICSDQGKIYANLFWGPRPRRSGVGLLMIDYKRETTEVWERRQGYDGEEEFTKTPLLPHSVFNAMQTLGEDHLYLATNSGLAIIDFSEQEVNKQLNILDETKGWSTEFINDICHEKLGPDSSSPDRIWLATPQGLVRLANDQLKLRIAGMTTALGMRKRDHSLWVAFKNQVWVGRGQIEKSWDKLKMTIKDRVGIIIHLFPRDDGGLWVVSTEGVFFHKGSSTSSSL